MFVNQVARSVHAAITALVLCVFVSPAAAQQREIPPPVPSTEVISLLERSGLSSDEAARAVVAHEAYFERYRSFEREEVERWLTDRSSTMAGMLMAGGSVADVEKDVLARRRLLSTARQLDEQLASEIGALVATHPTTTDDLRDALSRRRAWVVLRGFSGSDARPFSLADCPDFVNLSPEVRARLEPVLEGYERDLTRLWERALQSAIDRPLRMAELRELRGLTAPILPAPSADGEAPAIDHAAFQQYWESLQALRAEASADADTARRKVKDLHRTTLAQIEAALEPGIARQFLRWAIRENYPFLRAKGSPESLFKEAQELRTASKLEDAAWELVEAERAAYDMECRPVLEGLMKSHDESERGYLGGISFSMNADTSKDPEQGKLVERKEQIDARAVERMLAILGKSADANAPQQRGQELGGVSFGNFEISGDVQGVIGTAVMMVGDGQEMVMLSGDDFDGGAFLTLAGAPQRRMAKAMDRAESEALAKRLALNESERSVFDAVFEDYAANTRAIDDAFMPEMEAEAEGAGSPMHMFGIMSEMQGKLGELRGAIERADTNFFADLGVLCPSAKESGALEGARQARARALSTLGELNDPVTVDIAQAFAAAGVSAESRVAASESVRSWEVDATAQLLARAHELDAIARERALAEKSMHQEFTQEEADGSVARSISVSMNEDAMAKLHALAKREGEVTARVEKCNLAALESICGNMSAQDGLKMRRAWQRAAYPRVYDTGASAEGVFAKALALRELSAALKAEVEVLQAEYVESVERLAADFINRPKPVDKLSLDAIGGFDMQAMQLADRERMRLAADRDELNQSAVRRLKELLGSELGAKVGDLPAKKQPPTMQFQVGG